MVAGPWPVIAFAYSIEGFVSLVFFGGEGNFCPSLPQLTAVG